MGGRILFISSYWLFNYDTQGQAGFFSFQYFTLSLLTSLLHSMLRSHSATNSRVSEVSNFVLTSFMMSEVRWTAVENVIFFSKPSIVIKLPVMNMNLKFRGTSGSPDNQAFQIRSMCYCLSTLNQSIPAACRVFYELYSWLSSTRRLLNMELSLLLHQCQKLIYRSTANLLLELQSQFT